jgi:hypothetical protein
MNFDLQCFAVRWRSVLEAPQGADATPVSSSAVSNRTCSAGLKPIVWRKLADV